ncbi:MAG: hypothetical protein R3F60_14855 [bacterium]
MSDPRDAALSATAATNQVLRTIIDEDVNDPVPAAPAPAPTSAGTAVVTVADANTINFTGAVATASLGLSVVDPDTGMPISQSISLFGGDGSTASSANLIDTGGAPTPAELAAKLQAAIDAGPLAGLVNTALTTTTVADDAVLITTVALGQSVDVHTGSNGLAVVLTPGT